MRKASTGVAAQGEHRAAAAGHQLSRGPSAGQSSAPPATAGQSRSAAGCKRLCSRRPSFLDVPGSRPAGRSVRPSVGSAAPCSLPKHLGGRQPDRRTDQHQIERPAQFDRLHDLSPARTPRGRGSKEGHVAAQLGTSLASLDCDLSKGFSQLGIDDFPVRQFASHSASRCR